MNNTSLTPIRWLITPFAALAAFVASQELFSLLVSVIKPTLLPSLVLWTVSDWSGTAFSILTAVEIAPAKKGKVALVFAAILSVWHSILLFMAPGHPIAASYSHETIVITALGGFIIAGLLVLRVRRKEEVEIPGDELVQLMLQQLAESRDFLEANQSVDDLIELAADAEKEVQPSHTNIERDMLLLERELRYINLERTAYISAIRFAIAVERDASYRNCRGEFLLFHQIVLDSAMRLSVRADGEPFWKSTAIQFRSYEALSESERKDLLLRTEMLLPIEREPELTKNANVESEVTLEAAVFA